MDALSKRQQQQEPLSELKSKVSNFLSGLKKDIEEQHRRPVPPAPRVIAEDPEEMTESQPAQPAEP